MNPWSFKWIVVFLIIAAAGCNAIYIGSDDYYSNAPDEVKTFCEEFKSALAAKDWKKVKDMHWSGYQETQEELQKIYEPMLEKVGKLTDVQLDIYDEMNKDDYDEFWDREDIPGPVEILTGEIEFYLDGPQGEDGPYIFLDTFLAEEDGKIKILGYYERSVEFE